MAAEVNNTANFIAIEKVRNNYKNKKMLFDNSWYLQIINIHSFFHYDMCLERNC